jgi:hypothetical protein
MASYMAGARLSLAGPYPAPPIRLMTLLAAAVRFPLRMMAVAALAALALAATERRYRARG